VRVFAGEIRRIVYEADVPADLNGDCRVDTIDFLALLAAWAPCPGCPADLDGSGEVDVLDFLELLAMWSA
jgi:hypothetical protein